MIDVKDTSALVDLCVGLVHRTDAVYYSTSPVEKTLL
jgi:hypothetical protein